ncbi:hypothetical protein AQULUS_12250 [Aquicella lusitana]|uniref:F-box domain-containing protein n=2 Tax=Aquicella lusitana TaxID=254246 RepID=A0A370G7M4_9COXI|nr:hypothetical protein C8D86_12811 [Aquicella lusitana]VVC73485.1 hypothetical protein AQULUS_12250 [Aquicella lusitana]
MLDLLPKEIFLHVLSYLPLRDKMRVFFINISSYKLLGEDETWKFFCLAEQVKVSKDKTAKEVYLKANGFITTHTAETYYTTGNLIRLYHQPTSAYPYPRKSDDITLKVITESFPSSRMVSLYPSLSDALHYAKFRQKLFQLIPMECPAVFSVKVNTEAVFKQKTRRLAIASEVYYKKEQHLLYFFSAKQEQIKSFQIESLNERKYQSIQIPNNQ